MKKSIIKISLFVLFIIYFLGQSNSPAAAGDEGYNFIWAFKYEDKIGVHYGRIQISKYGTEKLDTESPFYLSKVFWPNAMPSATGSNLFESKKRYEKPDLSKYDFYSPYKDPEPRTGLLLNIKSFDGYTLEAQVLEATYGSSSVRTIKLTSDPDNNFYGTCEGSYLREYKITQDDVPALGNDWRSKGIKGKEFWLLIEEGGRKLYKDSNSVKLALDEGLKGRWQDIDLIAASKDAEVLGEGKYQATNEWYEYEKEPKGSEILPGKGYFEKIGKLIQEAEEKNVAIEGEDIIIESTITDSQWSGEKFSDKPDGLLEGMRDLAGGFGLIKGDLVAKEQVTADNRILKFDAKKSGYRIVKAEKPHTTGGAGKTKAEAVAGAIVEASRVMSTHIKREILDTQRSTQRGKEGTSESRVDSKTLSKSFNAIKHYKVTKLKKVEDSSGGHYECEIEFTGGKVVPSNKTQ